LRGRDQVREVVSQFRQAFPDAVFSPASDFIAEGDNVAARWKCQATHRGAFGSIPPTGKTVTWMGMSIIRVVDGKIVTKPAKRML
jgi:steroid delta-isomerase-like uncharacterized protein